MKKASWDREREKRELGRGHLGEDRAPAVYFAV